MIRPSLPPACYTSQLWFEREQQHIFRKLWLLAGLTQQLQQENSQIERNLGADVTVRRSGGILRAFCGNRPCALETVGNFVFVNLSENNPLPMTAQYSADILRLLRGISPHFAPDVSYTTFTGRYNWKLNFENILDVNHIPFVHQQTFSPLLKFTDSGNYAPAHKSSRLFGPGGALQSVRFEGDASEADGPTADDGRAASLPRASRCFHISMPYTPKWFTVLLDENLDRGGLFYSPLFPNMNFGSIHGEHFYLQQFVPLAPDRVEFHSWIFTAKLKTHVPPQPHLLWGIHHAEKRVVNEDIVLLEALQRALGTAHTVGVFGQHEEPLSAMGRWYMENVI
jgi:phenylpropionate dioxygenase-like ring-hydroxylating dioxygenase large terminal subunit